MKKQRVIIIFLSIVTISLGLFTYQVSYLRKAHSTFENYYAFRGCTKLIQRTDDYGLCQLGSGKTIKLVKSNGRWYLDGDLPICWHKICF